MDKLDPNMNFMRLANAANNLVQSPLIKSYSEHLKRDTYWKEINQYDSTRFTLTNKEIETLLLEIDAGRNTFKDLKAKIPNLNSSTLSYYLIDSPKLKYDKPISIVPAIHRTTPYYFQFDTIPSDFVAPYEFKDDDRLILSISGENELHRLKKELYLTELAEKSLLSSINSAKYGLLAAQLAGVSIIITILIALFK